MIKRKGIWLFALLICMALLIPGTAFAADDSSALNTANGPIWLDESKAIVSWPEVKGYTFYDIVVYRDGKRVGNKQYRGPASNGRYTMAVPEWINESGKYTFAVGALADGQRPSDCENYVTSQNSFCYNPMSISVATPQALQWRSNTASWESSNASNIEKYLVRYLKKINANEPNQSYQTFMTAECKYAPREDGFIYEGMGNFWKNVEQASNESYIFSVQAISSDLSQAANSPVVFLETEDAISTSSFKGKLDTPTGLEWRRNNGRITGDIAFYPVANQSNTYNVIQYKDGKVIASQNCSYGYDWNTGKNIIRMSNWIQGEGQYKLEIRATGDGVSTLDSAFAQIEYTLKEYTGKLPTPTGLEWCKEDGKITGDIAFYPVEGQGEFYNVVLIKNKNVVQGKFHSYFYDERTKKNIIEMSNWILDSGEYEVVVRAIGDGVRTFDSDFTEPSEVFHYIEPEEQLKAPNQVYWREHIAGWKGVVGAEDYLVDYYLNGKWTGSIHNAKTHVGDGYYVEDSGSFVRRIVNNNSDGKYTFTVRAISGEIHKVAHSKTSGKSGVMNLQAIAKDVDNRLDELIAKLKKGENAEISTDETMKFAVAMATKKDIREKMKVYEALYQNRKNIEVSVDVDPKLSIADQLKDKVTIDNATLNSIDNSDVTLNVSVGTEKNIDDIYKNCVFVEMKLDNGSPASSQDGSLKVPVRITMPVPENIHPDRFRIIHYFQDGSSEVIYPILSADKTMASYVLTHFSTFAFAEEIEGSTDENAIQKNPVEDTTEPAAPSFGGSYNYSATVNAAKDCDVTLSKEHAVSGEKVTIAVTPEKGKDVDSVIVKDAEGNIIPVTKTADNQYTFVMPEGKVNIEVLTEDAVYDNKVVLQIGSQNVCKNGEHEQNDVAPVLIGDRTVVPIRVIVEALGGTAEWAETSRTVTLNIGGKVLKLVIDQEIAGFGTGAVIMNSRTYVPVRYVAEYVGAHVEWIEASQQIVIQK